MHSAVKYSIIHHFADDTNLLCNDKDTDKVLRKKMNEDLRFIPVVVFTTSNNHQDLIKAFEIGVAGYIVKPLRYENYIIQIEKTTGQLLAFDIVYQL